MSTKTNSGLVAYAKAQVGLPYWYGTYGQTATASLYESKAKQYASTGYYTKWTDYDTQYNKRVHDCVGLIKGYLWSETTTSTPVYNSSQDKSAQGMYNASTTKGAIASFPKTAGLLVYQGNTEKTIHHVGVYGGDGYVYEAKGHQYGVVKTKYSSSDWQYWSQCPYCEDDTTSSTTTTTTSTTTTSSSTTSSDATLKFSVGDIVNFTGTTHYTSANGSTGKTTKSSLAKVMSVYKTGKHPYHLRAVDENGSYIGGVYGWVNASDVSEADTVTLDEEWVPAVGDTVIYNGICHYTSANGSTVKTCKGGKAKITVIYKLGTSKHPYHLVKVAGSGSTVNGWVDEGTFTKA